MATTYAQANASLAGVYNPQIKQVNTEIAQLTPQLNTTLSSLDQAKVNAFSDITNAANSKGMLFSGFSPDQQAKYIGTKYLPAVANAKTSFQNSKNSLVDKINQINANRASQAQNIAATSAKSEADAAYRNAQLQIAQQRLAISAAKASSGSRSTSLQPSDYQAAYNDIINTKGSNGMPAVGRDGYANPTSYNTVKSSWIAQGYSGSQFDSYFKSLKNPDQKKHANWEQYK